MICLRQYHRAFCLIDKVNNKKKGKKMKKFKVEITETLQKTVEVEADNKEEAVHKVMKMYKNEEVILNDNDFIDVDFRVQISS